MEPMGWEIQPVGWVILISLALWLLVIATRSFHDPLNNQ